MTSKDDDPAVVPANEGIVGQGGTLGRHEVALTHLSVLFGQLTAVCPVGARGFRLNRSCVESRSSRGYTSHD